MDSKRVVGKAFGRAAGSYDSHAGLQLAVARTLLSAVPDDREPELAVDLGAATAPLSHELRRQWPKTDWLALDLSPAMLQEGVARGRLGRGFAPVAADAEALPLADASVELVFSSFALQWCRDLPRLGNELNRVLSPGGSLVFSVPVAGTLAELAASWREVDDHVHVNELHSVENWRTALQSAGFQGLVAQTATIRQHYPDLRAISSMLRHTGAHHVNRQGETGLTSPRRLKRLVAAYERRREEGGLPLTWQVLYMRAEKPAARAADSRPARDEYREAL